MLAPALVTASASPDILGGSSWQGRSLADLDLRGRSGCSVLAVLRQPATLVNPSHAEVLCEGE